MTTATARADLSVIKARQQKTWTSGDYAVVASRIVLVSELLADAADLKAGWEVLDVACGNGNATLAAARSGTYALGVDYVPELLEDGRARAVAEGLDVEFRLGDTEDLPVDDESYDAVLSVFGAMFAPDHQRAADEIIRVARPGGTVGLASWTPDGFIGQMFGVITRHVPAAARRRIAAAVGHRTASTRPVRRGGRRCPVRASAPAPGGSPPPSSSSRSSAAGTGPTLKAFEVLDGNGRAALAADLSELARHWDRNRRWQHRHPRDLPGDRPHPPAMNQIHPGEDGSSGHAGPRSGTTRQDLMRKARHLANRHPSRAGPITPGDRGYDGAPRPVSQPC